MYIIYIYTLWTLEKIRGSTRISRQNETEWGKRSNEKYNRFLKRRNKEEIQWQIDLFESEKCKRKLKTTKPKIKKQLDQNHRIPLSQIEIPIILEPLQQQKPPIQKNLLKDTINDLCNPNPYKSICHFWLCHTSVCMLHVWHRSLQTLAWILSTELVPTHQTLNKFGRRSVLVIESICPF
jgi:hypothetical protein